MTQDEIELRITNHTGRTPKYSYDYYGDRYLNDDGGITFTYRHAKFRLPSGKPKCERFGGDKTDEQILAAVSKKYSNLKKQFKLVKS